MIEFKWIYKSYHTKEIFKDLNLVISKQTKGWIIGSNWSWKTTLFKLISTLEKTDSWEIIFHLKNYNLGYMYQEITKEENLRVIDFLKKETWLLELEIKMKELENDLQNKDKLFEYGDILEEYERLNWYDFDFEIDMILAWLWLKDCIYRDISTLSSGQKSKILLALALYKWKDILLLDEPTNNLDLMAINWLTDFIINSKATILIISHDRDFLDKVTNFTYEIDTRNNKIIDYKWNYSAYKKYKEEKFEREMLEYEKRQIELKNLKDAEIEVRQRMDKAENKKPRDNDKWQFKFFLDKATMSHWTKARFLSDRIEKMDKIEKPIKDKKIRFTIENSRNFWNIAVSLLSYEYPKSNFRLDIQKFEAQKNDRISIEWDNWSWKSTFLKILNKQISNYSWECNISSNIRIVDYNTEHNNLPLDITPVKLIMKEWELDEIEANKKLAIFNLEYKERYNEIRFLSPWQRAKLLLTLFKIKNFNTLILDEPTNHLDMEALVVLENALSDFDGILIVVSHDKRFLDNINITKRFEMNKWVLNEII